MAEYLMSDLVSINNKIAKANEEIEEYMKIFTELNNILNDGVIKIKRNLIDIEDGISENYKGQNPMPGAKIDELKSSESDIESSISAICSKISNKINELKSDLNNFEYQRSSIQNDLSI